MTECRFCGRDGEVMAEVNGERYCLEGKPPSCHQRAVRHVDSEKVVTWHREKWSRKRSVCHVEKVVGCITAVRSSHSQISTDEGVFPGIQFRIKPADGSRAVWTCAFADRPVAEGSP